MTKTFIVQEVPIETILHVGKLVNSSGLALSKTSIIEGMEGLAGKSYSERAITMAVQLGFIESLPGKAFKSSDRFKADFEKIKVDDYPLLANKALQEYAPFSKFLDYILMGYTSEQSANFVSSIFGLDKKYASGFFKRSGIYSRLLTENNGKIELVNVSAPYLDYITNLKNFLNSELEAKKLIKQLLGDDAFNYFSGKGIDFNKPAKSLVEIKKDPKTSMYQMCEFIEICLYHFGKDVGANIQTTNGIGQLVQAIRSANNTILTNPTNLGTGLGGLRNMANHGPDKETGKPWVFTEESTFGGSLLLLRFLRSIHLFHKSQIQEI